MGKNKKAKAAAKSKTLNNNIRWFQLGLVILTIVFYYNSLNNSFSFKDELVSIQHQKNPSSFLDLPEVFTTPYPSQNGFLINYRPLTKATYAIEYQFTSASKNNPQISHGINLLIYIIGLLLLFGVLKRIFNKYNIWFPFLVSLLFMAHPLHTEVVYNLRNRDFLLAFLFSLLALQLLLNWIKTKSPASILLGSVSFLLALLSHETALIMLAVFPLIIYYFSETSLKPIIQLTGIQALVALIALAGPMLYLSLPDTEFYFIDNPLYRDDSFISRILAFFSTMGWSLKMLLFPYPLRFYYGYNVVSIVNWSDIWLWISIVLNTGLMVLAIMGIKKKSLLSFVVFFYFITTIPFSNLFVIVPGIVYERLLFTTALSVSMAIVWLVFFIFRPKLMFDSSNNSNITGIGIVVLMILGIYFTVDNNRGKDWQNRSSIINADQEKLENSAGFNNYLAESKLRPIIVEMAKPVSPYKFILPSIKSVESYTWKAMDMDTLFTPGYERMGYIYSQIHGKQSFLRYESFKNRELKEKMEEEERTLLTYFLQADTYFNKALEFGSRDSANVYFLKSEAFAIQFRHDDAAISLLKAIELEPDVRKYRAKLIDAYLRAGRFNTAMGENENYRKRYPDSDVPDRNLGGIYYFRGDTTNAIIHYEKAITKGTRPEVGKLLHKYYSEKGNIEKANYYLQKAYEAEQYYDPEKY